MSAREAWVLFVLLVCPPAMAEGGCPAGQTPTQFGAVMGCAPGGNDAATTQSSERSGSVSPTGYWQTTWGAIAPSPKGGILGTAVGAKSEMDAERLALADCRAKGGKDCSVNLVYHNQCAAMVVGDEKLKLFGAESVARASALAMSACSESDSNCRVFYSACTEPIFHRY